MNERLVHLVTRLYPRSWRNRYGEEFEALLLDEPCSLRNLVNVVSSAIGEHAVSAHPASERQPLQSFCLIVKRPSAIVPMAMSLAALDVVLVQIAITGVARQTDEGAAAHTWQLLMAGQLPMLLFFAIKWLPKAPRQTLCVLAVQVAAIMVSLAPVFLLNW